MRIRIVFSYLILIHYNVFLGLIQGIVMGVRSLCNGIGPALFGIIFYLCDVDLYYNQKLPSAEDVSLNGTSNDVTVTNYNVSICNG